MLSPIINTRLVTSAMVLDGLVQMVSGLSSYFVLSSVSPHFSLLRYWRCYLFEFLRICSSYVNGTFIFSETVVIIGPMNGIFGYIIVSFGVYCTGVFLGNFADRRLLHDLEVQSSMDLHSILMSKVLPT